MSRKTKQRIADRVAAASRPPIESEFRLAIVGRPNVGKSTLFNRLLGHRRALVHDLPGVTRDRLEERAKWIVRGRTIPLSLIDTGGLGGESWIEEIRQQVEIALGQADAVLVVFDSQSGLTPHDEEVVRSLQTSGLLGSGKVAIGAVNKVDDRSHEDRLTEFYAMGLDAILGISAEHGRGIDELQELIIERLEAVMGRELGFIPAEPEPVEVVEDEVSSESESELEDDAVDFEDLEALDEEEEEAPEPLLRTPKIAIVGRPNVGKSTLVNALLGEQRMIASPIAGTTVDAVDSEAELGGQKVILIDTAGIRRKSKTEKGVEVLSVVQARKALERCDVAVLLLDGEHGITDQDEKIGGLIEEIGCGVILALNKWDTQRKNPAFTREHAAERVRKEVAFLRYAPLMFLSGKEGMGFEHLGELVVDILQQRRVRISTREFTEFVRTGSTVHNPMNAKFYLCHQTGRNPPTFVCHVSDPDKVHFSLRRYLMNTLREKWGFMGSPVRLLFVQASSDRRAKTSSERQKVREVRREKAQVWEKASSSLRKALTGKARAAANKKAAKKPASTKKFAPKK